MRDVAPIAALGLFTGTLLILLWQAPVPVVRELIFAALILAATVTTRSMGSGSGLSALGLGSGVVVLIVVGAGHLLARAGLDMRAGAASWALMPMVEELLKLAAVAVLALLHARRQRVTPTPSDLLMLGCLAGTGFALAENSSLLLHQPGVSVGMAEQYGPDVSGWYLVPAWGAAGYVGHAAATGFIAGGFGLGLALGRRLKPLWWLVPAACGLWIVLEHMLANLYAGAGSPAALLLGGGRMTPWLFVLLVIVIVVADRERHRAALRRWAPLRARVDAARAAVSAGRGPVPAAAAHYFWELRRVNAAAWRRHDA